MFMSQNSGTSCPIHHEAVVQWIFVWILVSVWRNGTEIFCIPRFGRVFCSDSNNVILISCRVFSIPRPYTKLVVSMSLVRTVTAFPSSDYRYNDGEMMVSALGMFYRGICLRKMRLRCC